MLHVRVYYNLHNRLWSVMCRTSGKVIGHARWVHLRNVQFVVRQGGRKRVIETGRKNVHAFASGNLWRVDWVNKLSPLCEAYGRDDGEWWGAETQDIATLGVPITYNPFAGPRFTRKDTGEMVGWARDVVMTPDRKVLGGCVRGCTESGMLLAPRMRAA